ncbi:MAG: FmdB family zinc ribbon protein [Verrucomicrobiae bacterium]
MPTYEYECEKCRKTFDVFQSMKDPVFKTCPEAQCRMRKWGKGKVRRLVGTGAGLIFKGSGFYITDYRSEGYKQSEKKESGEASKPAAAPDKSDKADKADKPKPEPKKESKPEPKKESKPGKKSE